ncbi:unnamed protein product [Musa textilis]
MTQQQQAENNWEPRGASQQEQKIKDPTKKRSCSVSKGFDEDVEGISGGECHGHFVNGLFGVMLMHVRVPF